MTRDVKSAIDGRRALVTGGAGFIGSHLCDALVSLGCGVTVLDDLSTGRIGNLPSEVRFVQGSVTQPDVVADLVSECDLVFHLAAMVSVPASVADPEGCFERNVVGTECVVRAAARAGVAGFVHTSSSAVYGPHPCLPSRECDPIACASPYAASKACGEILVQAAALSSGLPGVSLRLFNVFGPRQDPKSPYAAAVSAFAGAALERRSCKIYGSGDQTRDFVPVSQVVEAFLVAGAYGRRVAGESFNVGLGRGTSVRELAAVIAHVAGSEAPPELHPPRAGDVEHSRACIDKIRNAFGLRLDANLEEAFASLVRAQVRHCGGSRGSLVTPPPAPSTPSPPHPPAPTPPPAG